MEKTKKIVNKNWDISKVSKNLEIFKLIEKCKSAWIKEFKLRPNLANSLKAFKEWWFAYNYANTLDDKIDVIKFAFQNKENKTDTEKDWLTECSRAGADIDDAAEKIPFLSDLFRKNEKKIRGYLKDSELAKYKTKIEIKFLQGAKHNLDEEHRKISQAMGGIQQYLDIYFAAREDYNTPWVYDKNGKRFSKVTWNQLFRHQDPNVRRDTYKAWYSFQVEHRRMISEIVYYICRAKYQKAKLHNYESEIHRIVGSIYHISLKDFWKMIDQSPKFAKLNNKFVQFKQNIIKNAFGLEKFEPWDSHLKIDNVQESITIPQAKEIVVNSLSCLGKDYVENIKNIYKKDIIQWKSVNSDQTNGGCMSGLDTLDENPISIQWDGTMIAAQTLSHELGHNLKNHYGKINNEVNYHIDKICCEVPSIVNQLLTTFYLIDKYKKEKNANYLYGTYLKSLNYLFHCISKAGFYMKFYDRFINYCLKSKEYKPIKIEELYLNTMRDVLAIPASLYNLIYKGKEYYWYVRLNAFTTYISMNDDGMFKDLSYYIGCIVALPIAYKIYNGNKQVLSQYLKFLKTGNDTNPLKPIKTLGIDVTKPRIYTETKEILSKIVNQFIKDIKIDVTKKQ